MLSRMRPQKLCKSPPLSSSIIPLRTPSFLSQRGCKRGGHQAGFLACLSQGHLAHSPGSVSVSNQENRSLSKYQNRGVSMQVIVAQKAEKLRGRRGAGSNPEGRWKADGTRARPCYKGRPGHRTAGRNLGPQGAYPTGAAATEGTVLARTPRQRRERWAGFSRGSTFQISAGASC